jgi:hypothetical protein
MAQRHNILQELQELQSSLVNVTAENVYLVPAGYFEGLAEEVLKRIKALEAENPGDELNYLSPLLSSISKKMPYSVPAGFFNELEERIDQVAKNENELTPTEELAMLSPLLSGMKKEMPYTVPQNYFENITPAVQPRAKVVSITKQEWFRYAAAAVVTGFIAMAGFLIFKNNNVDPVTDSAKWVNNSMKKVSTDEINNFVQLADEEAPVIASADTKIEIKDKNDIQELIKDIPDNAIDNFLDETQTAEPDNNDGVLMN